MTAADFIDTLEGKQLLSEKMATKLRAKVASSSKPLTAKSLARFLIDKGIISKPEVVEALAAGGEIDPPPPEPSSTGEPSGVDLPMDQLQDLSSSSEWTMDGESGAFSEPTSSAMEAAEPAKKKKKKVKKGDEWDSPLLLIGGGSLVLMIVVGTLIYFIMFAEGADKILNEARTNMENGSYGNAIANYEKFVENYKGNAEYSKARVELAMARIRQLLDTGNEEDAFDKAEEELNIVGSEPDFKEAAEENLSDLLPRIARSLANEAEKSTDSDETTRLFDKATRALQMANNSKYIPKSRRDNTELDEIRATLDAIGKRQQSLTDLQQALTKIAELIEAGDAAAAFAEQEMLVGKHPSLLSNAKLAEALEKISATEQKNIRFVDDPLEPSTSERESNLRATLAIANKRMAGNSPASGVVCIVIDGSAYGIDASNGTLLWRRHTGPAQTPIEPILIENDVLLVDWRMPEPDKPQQSLMRVEASSGSLVWRLEVDDQLAPPVLAGDKVLLAGTSGKLHVVDAKSGSRSGYVQFAQPLICSPAVDPQRGTIYLTGERSSLYSLSSRDYSCLDVTYTKHARGSVLAPPAVIIDKVVVVENDGADTCAANLYSTAGNGAIEKRVASKRLAGRVVTRPIVRGRQVTFVTDRGQVGVYEVNVGEGGTPLALVAQRAQRNTQPQIRFAQVLDGHVWLAEDSLIKYAISPTGNRLTAVGLSNDYNRSQFVSPISLRNDVLIHTRAQRRRAGFTVVASSVKDGSPYWETDLGTPPAGNPLASSSPLALLVSDANGQVYRFNPDGIKTRAQNQALKSPVGGSNATVYQHSALLDAGAAVFASEDAEHALLYSPSAPQPLIKVDLASPLACRPTAFEKGWIAPLTVGQVFLMNAQSGDPLAAPFQPKLAAGRSLAWKPAAIFDQDQLLITDGTSKLYLMGVRDEGAPALAAVAEANLALTPLETGFAVADNLAIALASNGQLATYQLPSLEPTTSPNPGGRVVWGPYAAGNRIVMATANSLTAIDSGAAVAWQVPLASGSLAGLPLTLGSSMVVASQSGELMRINLTDGSIENQVTAGEPLASGPALLGKRVVVSARDGSLLVIDAP